jgi:hypothetical protein
VNLAKFLCCCLVALIFSFGSAGDAHAAGEYSMSTGLMPFTFIQGDSIQINLVAPSPELAQRMVLKVNGIDVTNSLRSTGARTMSGNVSGLIGGENVFQLFANKSAKKPTAQLKLTHGIPPKVDCASMKGRTVLASDIGLPTKGVTITETKLVAAVPPTATANWGVPEYCAVSGAIAPVDPAAPNIDFQVDIPTSWNQKAFHEGGGGTNGTIPQQVSNPASSPFATEIPGSPSVLAEGYAIFGGDSGHQSRFGRGPAGPPQGRGQGAGPGAPPSAAAQLDQGARGRGPTPTVGAAAENAWITNQEAWMNFAYEALKKTHDAAMQIMLDMYGTKSKVTYFIGTSQGGREGLEVLSRYPNDYDGVLSQVPLAYFAGLLFDPTVKGVSQLAPGTWVPPAKAPAIAAEIVRQCDSLDGLEDGVISNYMACDRKLDPAVTPNPLANIRCAGGEDTGNNCLSDKQIATVDSFHTAEHFGFPMVNGESDWPGWGTGMEGNPGIFGWLLSATQPDVNNPTAFNGGIGAGVQKGRLGGQPGFQFAHVQLPRLSEEDPGAVRRARCPRGLVGVFQTQGQVDHSDRRLGLHFESACADAALQSSCGTQRTGNRRSVCPLLR